MRGILRILGRWARGFARDQAGFITVQNLFLTVACCAVGAAGLDVTGLYQARTQLQVAADTAAHAALYSMYQGKTAEQAKDAAVGVANYATGGANATVGPYGTVLERSDIVFGTWNMNTATFTRLPATSTDMPTAVAVTTNRAGDNPVGSFLFRIVGITQMDVSALAIYSVTGDPCATMQGLFGVLQVSANGNNNYSNGICVHSQDEVDLQANNDFTKDSVVSAPNKADITCGNGCDNFELVKRSENRDLEPWLSPIRPVASETPEILLGQVRTVVGSARLNSWLTTTEIQSYLGGYDITPSSLVAGRATYIGCTSGGTLRLGADKKGSTVLDTFSNVVLLTNCKIDMKGVTFSNAVVYTTNTSGVDKHPADASVSIDNGADGVTLGTDTTCSGNGYAAILTRGASMARPASRSGAASCAR
ncbi:hypothetical protein Rumeso_02294 [Rubellimicrobium mesophilum DSM 19309]|uniref:Uncharacterized protein n=1 Tax=Rubellimicrobium mesophilum DSM 19309 TaxID=442562 RepID=A0A017HP80_9RHOB|nr:pilus assembly protein TadG-related protein [Rubellimicrobium mesophilum]EYD76105.1 hypothetical protein Rumeso_02294 [Rubellimicrobium mesophilum DSM 19309]